MTKPPPNSQESEIAVVSTVYQWPQTYATAATIIEEADFYSPVWGSVFSAIGALSIGSGCIDPVILGEALKRKGDLDRLGGFVAISKLGDYSATSARIKDLCELVKEYSCRRKMIKTGERIAKDGYECDDPQEYLSDSVSAVSAVVSLFTRLEVHPMHKGFPELLTEIYSDRGQAEVVPSGYQMFDHKIGGFTKGLPTIIAGDTSMGKSLVALNFALNMAQQGTRVFYATLEDRTKNQQRRALSIRSGVQLQTLKRGNVTDPVLLTRITRGSSVANLPVDFVDMPTTAEKLAQKCLAYRSQHRNERVVFIWDHLLYLRGRRGESEYDRVTNAIRVGADMAKETDSPLIALCQLNRDLTKRVGDDKAPKKSDLKSSGALEQDARLILGVFRPWEYDKDADPSRLELRVLKYTDGASGFKIVFRVNLPTVAMFDDYNDGY